MRRLFDHENQQKTRWSRHALIIALSVLLSPMTGWTHDCGPQTLKVKKGKAVSYAITGFDFIEFRIVDKGDPLVAKIEPPINNDQHDVVFKIKGTGDGTTEFKIFWKGPVRQDTCHVEVTVAD